MADSDVVLCRIYMCASRLCDNAAQFPEVLITLGGIGGGTGWLETAAICL